MYKITAFSLLLFLLACGNSNSSLVKVTEEELIEKFNSDQIPEPGSLIIRNTLGNVVTEEYLRRQAMTGNYWTDTYKNEAGDWVELRIRKKTREDEAIFIKMMQMKNNAEEITCSDKPTPEFDETRYYREVETETETYMDTIINRMAKRRDVFKACREFIYQAKFYSKENELLTDSQIKLIATGHRWAVQPEMQDEIIINYEYTLEDKENSKANQLNKTKGDMWSFQSTTGVIENVEKVWMHPFRSNQFAFTEVAPFPEIKRPLEIGNFWTSGLSIGQGWGDWSNTSSDNYYEVVAKEDCPTTFGLIKDCWKVEASSDYPFGKSFITFWFSEEYGFVKKEYLNYGGQKLNIELVNVIDK